MKNDVEGSVRPEFRGRLFRLQTTTKNQKVKKQRTETQRNKASLRQNTRGGRSTGVTVHAPGARLASEPRATVASVPVPIRAVLSG